MPAVIHLVPFCPCHHHSGIGESKPIAQKNGRFIETALLTLQLWTFPRIIVALHTMKKWCLGTKEVSLKSICVCSFWSALSSQSSFTVTSAISWMPQQHIIVKNLQISLVQKHVTQLQYLKHNSKETIKQCQ